MFRPLPSLLALATVALAAGCSSPAPSQEDAGAVLDSGTAGLSCAAPEQCRAQGFEGVCRGGACRADVPCGDDAECGIGEECQGGRCRFTGCTQDADCPVGRCRTDVYACTECAQNLDCPETLPVCSPQGRCVRCASDGDCRYPGPAHCEAASGACVHCKQDAHCPQGLNCGPGGVCHGAAKGAFCDTGIACDLGLTCVNVGGQTKCLEACNVYVPTCPAGEICIKLTFQDSPSLVFDQGAPVGVCYPPVSGLRGYREQCAGNCQPNLECVPDSATASTCKAYCDPAQPSCAPNEKCHPYPGDWAGHQYGLCYADNGYGDACDGDGECKAGLACVPRDDPSTSSELSNFCRWSVGPGPGLSPCTLGAQCQSGTCRGDPVAGIASFFQCFAACEEDADCSVGGRQGVCDAKFSFTTAYVTAEVKGCRPTCDGPKQCAAYPAGVNTCRLSVVSATATALQTCGTAPGALGLGEPCGGDLQCASGLCLRRDGRGAFRQGVCSTPCEDAADCQAAPADGGTPVTSSCEPAALLANLGPDGQMNTADDRHALTRLCGGAACAQDADCQGPFPHCVPDVDPANPLGNLAPACRAPSLGGTKLAGEACWQDGECQSGVCAEYGAGTQRTCLQLCVPGGAGCAGTLSCVAGGARIRRGDGMAQTFDACVP